MPACPPRWFALTATLLLLAPTAHAMTPNEAATNLMFLVAARNEGHFCQQFGGRTVDALMDWENRHAATFRKSNQTIEDHAVATGTTTRAEASTVSLTLLARLQRRDDQELAPGRNQRTCAKYRESLEVYGAKLVR